MLNGLVENDEYLFNQDYLGRSQACQKLSDLGMKQGLIGINKAEDIDTSTVSVDDAAAILNDDSLTALLLKHKVFQRAHDLGKQRQSQYEREYEECKKRVLLCKEVTRKSHKKGKSSAETAAAIASLSAVEKKSWYAVNLDSRIKAWRKSRSVLTDRVMIETETLYETCTIDAKRYGSIGRFLNHSCEPNLEKYIVFCESQDVRIPR